MSEKHQLNGAYSNPGYQQGGYPPQQGGYPPQQGGYPPQQGGYPPQQGGYPSQQGGYPPQQHNSYQQAPSMVPQTQGLPQQQQYGTAQKAPVQWDPSTAQQYHGEMSDDYQNERAEEPVVPSAPPPLDVVLPGYENVAYNEAAAGPPPSYDSVVGEAASVDSSNFKSITSEEAKEALLEYVSQECCYGKGAAKDMDIKDIQSTSAFHYTLETFTEGRTTKWHYVPYSGGFVDGPHNGPAPGPWDIQSNATALFKTEVKKVEIPHTASVRACHVCCGRGFNRCWHCHGRGRIKCSHCQGSGHRNITRDGQTHRESCPMCHGRGKKRCYTCSGMGCVRCKECQGFGKLKQFIQLTISYSNNLSDHIIERTDMPDHLIRDVTGDVIFQQAALRVGPVQNFIEQEINRRSSELVSSHATAWPAKLILQQRHKLTAVPVYECRFKFKDKEGRFWVYGHQHSVYTKEYPHTCCCCNIL
uniref:protein SSUH2 homolog isoform X2 n=1 Tax=Ciona intestinalis TaxID=7719 RepID=UPI000EF4C7F1|nr:protein SSUH2 homolog isoform X2 [Ciona intestinalis]|eukprot:XP_026695861.1 protein SSUH2 homolog isoform X2 [Ciona intestinalis]